MNDRSQPTYESVIQQICQLDWAGLDLPPAGPSIIVRAREFRT
jgi:hypothetical protein